MSNAKNRGVDVSAQTKEAPVSVQRLMNLGEKVITAKGELTVKEPTLEQVIELFLGGCRALRCSGHLAGGIYNGTRAS